MEEAKIKSKGESVTCLYKNLGIVYNVCNALTILRKQVIQAV